MSRFVAVELPGDVAAAVSAAVAPLRDGAAGLRWVDAARYHLTVVFCGGLPDERLAATVAAVRLACAGTGPFELTLDGRLGHFSGRVLWAGLEPSPPLERVAEAVRSALAGIVELPDPGRRLHPHLTLARAPGRRRARRAAAGPPRPGGGSAGGLERVAAPGSVPVLRWTVSQLALLRSPPPGPGAGYVREAVAPLGAPDA